MRVIGLDAAPTVCAGQRLMARIRSLHPGQWTDEAFVAVSPLARLLALGLRNEADDEGVFPWKPVTLRMRLLPADNATSAS